MARNIYTWKRFWCPPDGRINLEDRGFLYNPDSEYGHIYNPDVKSFEGIYGHPCLVMLGEPGIGKSCSINAEFTSLKKELEGTEDLVLCVDLKEYGSETTLREAVFGSKIVAKWREGRCKLHLFLDSLDECLLKVDTVTSILAAGFEKCPSNRLLVRIACRTADWPGSFESRLRTIWGDEGIGVFELVPLRRVDVATAAATEGISPDDFISEVIRMGVVALAIKPVTLGFLINLYRKSNEFPSTQSEIYLEGCRLLCEETNESRRERKLTGRLSADQRLAIASRIAAVTVLGNKFAVWTGVDRGDVPGEDVTIRQIAGGVEESGGDIPVTEAAISETLRTGLFSSRGTHRLGWAHKTYAEFLAAKYLVDSKMKREQVISVLVHTGDADGKIVPQLHECAAWVAAMVPDLFRAMVASDPEVLLRSDVAKADPKDRRALVDAWLDLVRNRRTSESRFELSQLYGRLDHPDMAEQLRPLLGDRSESRHVRFEAIGIAKACRVKGLLDDVMAIALDESENPQFRAHAGYAIDAIGEAEDKLKLKPFATGDAGDDPDDLMRACGLEVLWPSQLTVKELFDCLTPPKGETIANYHLFLRADALTEHLKQEDLPVALNWARHHIEETCFGTVVDGVMRKAWEHIDNQEVRIGFANILLVKLTDHDPWSESDELLKAFENDDDRRRLVIKDVLEVVKRPWRDGYYLVSSNHPLILRKDYYWLLEIVEGTGPAQQKIVSWFIAFLFNPLDSEQLEALYKARMRNSVLREATDYYFFIEIDSKAARAQKKHHQRMQEMEQRRSERNEPVGPPPEKRVRAHLERIESGEYKFWLNLNAELLYKPDGTRTITAYESDLMKYPGWDAADEPTRARITEAAKTFLRFHEPSPDQCTQESILNYDFAGYRALRLVQAEAPSFFEELDDAQWRSWATIAVQAPNIRTDEDEESVSKLVAVAHKKAPDEVNRATVMAIDAEDRKHNDVFALWKVGACIDERMSEAILESLRARTYGARSVGKILSFLLQHNIEEARKYGRDLLADSPESGSEEEGVAAEAAAALFGNSDDGDWDRIWPILKSSPRFADQFVGKLSHDGLRSASLKGRLTERQKGDWYIQLAHAYPFAEDPNPPPGKAYTVTDDMTVREFRDSILQQLEEAGTRESCEEIVRIAVEFPDQDWINRRLLRAQSIARARMWHPPSPEDIIRLAHDARLRLIKNGHDLLAVLAESLKRLQDELQGETYSAPLLWDENQGKRYRPKDENRLSDYVKLHLDKDIRERGIVADREVEIRRKSGGSAGEETDIHVDAFVSDGKGGKIDVITAIIETKGCWHDEVLTAMETQLADRYLKDNQCQNGLYLVGWFQCSQWDEEDYRKGRVPSMSLDKARKHFSKQASDLSNESLSITSCVLDTALR